MTVTVSDAFPRVEPVGEPVETPGSAPERSGTRARPRAGEYRSLPVVGKVRGLAATVVGDLRGAWWMPASLPTLRQAWEQRMPDRDKVPGGSGLLYRGWVVHNHTVGLAVPAVAVAVMGALTLLVWVARHPARVGLAAALAAPLVFSIFI